METFFADPTSIATLRALDFWFGAVGFVITMATFVLGWMKLRTVQIEVENVKSRFAKFDAVFELSEFARIYDDIIVRLDDPSVDWRSIASDLSKIKRNSSKIEKLLLVTSEDGARELKKISTKIEKFVMAIDAAYLGKNPLPEEDVFRKFIRNAGEIAVSSRHHLEESVK